MHAHEADMDATLNPILRIGTIPGWQRPCNSGGRNDYRFFDAEYALRHAQGLS